MWPPRPVQVWQPYTCKVPILHGTGLLIDNTSYERCQCRSTGLNVLQMLGLQNDSDEHDEEQCAGQVFLPCVSQELHFNCMVSSLFPTHPKDEHTLAMDFSLTFCKIPTGQMNRLILGPISRDGFSSLKKIKEQEK